MILKDITKSKRGYMNTIKIIYRKNEMNISRIIKLPLYIKVPEYIDRIKYAVRDIIDEAEAKYKKQVYIDEIEVAVWDNEDKQITELSSKIKNYPNESSIGKVSFKNYNETKRIVKDDWCFYK